MKLAVAVLCSLCVAYVKAQGMAELAMMTSLLGRSGSGSGGSNPLAGLTSSSSSSSSNPLAALTGGSSGSSGNPLAAMASSGSGNPLNFLMGGGAGGAGAAGGMGRFAGGMMLGGAEMSSMMDFYMCGQMRLPLHMCMLFMQQNM